MPDELNVAGEAVADTVQPDQTTQAPDTGEAAAVEQAPEPAKSSREALERAFAKVGEPGTDAKPAEQAEAVKTGDGRERDEKGRFKPKGEAQAVQPGQAQPPADAGAQQEQPPTTEAVKPAPESFSKEAQAEWAKTPAPVRAEVERRLTELTTGIEQYRASFEPIKRFDEMAKQSGTTLDQALENYTGLEHQMRTNPVAGTFAIFQNMGLDPRQMVAALVQAVNGQQPAQVRPQGDSPEVQALKAEVAELKKGFGGLQSTLTEGQAQQQVDKFASEKAPDGSPLRPYFNELEDTMAQLLETKFVKNLSEAYDKAVLLHPDVAAKIAKDKASKEAPKPDPAQTRAKADLSTTGSPSAGSSPGTRKPSGSSRESLQNAFAQVGIT